MADAFSIPGFDHVEEVGRGAFGVVYRARQIDFDRLVAIKVLTRVVDAQARSRLARERRALGLLSSQPNIVAVYSSGETAAGDPYIVMEFAPGGSLADRVATDGPMAADEAARIGAQLSTALGEAHDSGILHRDVKPENVLFSARGEPMLADFGIARISGLTGTSTGIVTASLAHAAPEILDGKRPTEMADQYALASTLYTAVSGRAPFVRDDDESMITVIARTATDAPPDLRVIGVPERFAATLERALAKAPEDRFASVREFGQALDATTNDQKASPTFRRPDIAPRPTPEPPRLPPQPTGPDGGRPAAGQPRVGIDLRGSASLLLGAGGLVMLVSIFLTFGKFGTFVDFGSGTGGFSSTDGTFSLSSVAMYWGYFGGLVIAALTAAGLMWRAPSRRRTAASAVGAAVGLVLIGEALATLATAGDTVGLAPALQRGSWTVGIGYVGIVLGMALGGAGGAVALLSLIRDGALGLARPPTRLLAVGTATVVVGIVARTASDVFFIAGGSSTPSFGSASGDTANVIGVVLWGAILAVAVSMAVAATDPSVRMGVLAGVGLVLLGEYVFFAGVVLVVGSGGDEVGLDSAFVLPLLAILLVLGMAARDVRNVAR